MSNVENTRNVEAVDKNVENASQNVEFNNLNVESSDRNVDNTGANRKGSRFRNSLSGLVTGTLKFARAYSDVDLNRTEQLLEEELRRESFVPPANFRVARLRRRGEKVLHSKHVLLVIVILNLIDCALVLGELVLDINYVKELRETTETSSQAFIDEMQRRYPHILQNNHISDMSRLYEQIYEAECYWNISKTTTAPIFVKHPGNFSVIGEPRVSLGSGSVSSDIVNETYSQPHTAHDQKEMTSQNKNDTKAFTDEMVFNDSFGTAHESDKVGSMYAVVMNSASDAGLNTDTTHTQQETDGHHGHGHDHAHGHTIWVEIAHGMHKASITILGILFVENICKLIFMGRDFFRNKLEVFDAVVVILSFIIDLVFLKGITGYRIQNALLILSFLLPWRVIRVVNSLIVAVLDHEHFRLKLLYQEKKGIAAELKVLKEKDKKWDFHLQKIEKFCESEGIPKWKIRQHTAMGRKQSTITSMASLALNGLLTGMMTGPEDHLMFAKSMSLTKQDSAASNLDIIDEDDDTSGTGDNQDSEKNVTATEINTPTRATETHNLTETNNNGEAHNHSILHPHLRTNKRVSFDNAERKPLLRQMSVRSRGSESITSDLGDSPTTPGDSQV